MVPEIRYENIVPNPEDYNRLRRNAGWPEMDPGTAADCLPNSNFAVCAFVGEEMIGTGRVVGDGGLCFYIQDVIVMKDFQRRRIGSAIMDRIMAFIASRAVKDSYIGLMAAVEKEPFYRRYGFTVRPTETLGSGMTRFWTDP